MALPALTPAQLALLPKDKFDSTNTIAQLATFSSTSLEPLVPHLLTWLQDSNWPIFTSVRDLLLEHPSILVEPVRNVLREHGDDAQWELSLLDTIVPKLQVGQRRMLRSELQRIRDFPTQDERKWELIEVSEDLLKEIDDEDFGKTDGKS